MVPAGEPSGRSPVGASTPTTLAMIVPRRRNQPSAAGHSLTITAEARAASSRQLSGACSGGEGTAATAQDSAQAVRAAVAEREHDLADFDLVASPGLKRSFPVDLFLEDRLRASLTFRERDRGEHDPMADVSFWIGFEGIRCGRVRQHETKPRGKGCGEELILHDHS